MSQIMKSFLGGIVGALLEVLAASSPASALELLPVPGPITLALVRRKKKGAIVSRTSAASAAPSCATRVDACLTCTLGILVLVH